MELHGRAVLITGASAGLGEALARELARAGARLGLVARRKEPLERLVAELRAAGAEAHAIPGDVGSKEAILPIAGSAQALLGPIDLLVNNAGSLGEVPLPLLLDTACETLQLALDVNLLGPFRLTKALVGPMVLRGSGVVLHVSSDAAVTAYPRWGAYGVSKAALDHLARSFAVELEGTGVRFLAVDPGELDTKLHADAVPAADRATLGRPGDVARRIVAALREPRGLPGSGRLDASREPGPERGCSEGRLS